MTILWKATEQYFLVVLCDHSFVISSCGVLGFDLVSFNFVIFALQLSSEIGLHLPLKSSVFIRDDHFYPVRFL